MSIRQLTERRGATTREMTAILAAAGDNDLGDEARARFDTLKATADALNGQIERRAVVDDLERRAAGAAINGSGDANFDALSAQVSVLDVIRAQMGSTDAGAGRAREVSAELERRSGRKAEGMFAPMGRPIEQRQFTTSNPVGGPGSNLIQTTVSPNLIDVLRNRSIVRQLGATVLTGLVGNLSIPRLKQSATAYWVAEGGTITASDPATDAVPFTPKHVGGIVSLSRNLVQQPSLDVARMVEGDLAALIATGVDQVSLVGGGTNQPSGLLASGSGISTVFGGTNGLAPTWANVINLIGQVDTSNALSGSLGFATNAKVVKANRSTAKTPTDTASNFLQPDAATLAGYRLASSQNVPSNLTRGSGTNLSALLFGDWSQLVLAFWSELDILVSPYDSTGFASGSVLVRAMATADVRLKQPLAFAALGDIIAP